MKSKNKLLKKAFHKQVQRQSVDLSWQDIKTRLPTTRNNKGSWLNSLSYALSITLVAFLMLVKLQPVQLTKHCVELVKMTQSQNNTVNILIKSTHYIFQRRKI